MPVRDVNRMEPEHSQVGRRKFETRNSKSEIGALFPDMMSLTAAGVAEWQTLGT
jgi:hypothetical protein